MSAEEKHELAILLADLLTADLAKRPPTWMVPSHACTPKPVAKPGENDKQR